MGWMDRLLGRDSGRSGDAAEISGRRGDDPFAFIADPGDIPADVAYPTQESYPLLSASGVLVAHRDQVRQAYRAFDARDLMPGFDQDFAQLMTNFASWVSLLPASKRYHHAKPGGLFAHSLDVATKALHYSAGFIVNQDSAPRDREVDKFAWALAAFIVGLLHDIGKVETNGIVVARGIRRSGGNGYRSAAAPNHRMVWHPEVGPLTDWVVRHGIESVMIEFRDAPEKDGHIRLIHPYFYRIVPRAFVSLLFNSNPRIGEMLRDFLQNPGSASRAPLFSVVRDADHQSVRYDREPRGLPGAIDLNTLIVRRFLEFATEQRFWNAPSSHFVHAYLERRAEADFRHYFELDFFVATDEAVASFTSYLRNGKNFGISLPDELERAAFDALLGNGVLHATIPGILPVAAPGASMPRWIPATTATVRYSMKLEATSTGSPRVHPLHGDELLFERPLLALSRSPVAGHRDYMPVVSFEGAPGLPSRTIAVRIEEDGLRPADALLDDDPVVLEEIARAAGLDPSEANEMDRELARGFSRIARRRRTRTLELKPTDRFPNLEREREEEAAAEVAEAARIAAEGTRGGDARDPARAGLSREGGLVFDADGVVIEDERASSQDDGIPLGFPKEVPAEPAWLRFGRREWSGSAPALGAMLWLHMTAQPGNAKARREGSDHILPKSALGSENRDRIIKDLRHHGVSIGNIAATWPAIGLPVATVRQIAKPLGSDEVALRPACLDILAAFERESPDAD